MHVLPKHKMRPFDCRKCQLMDKVVREDGCSVNLCSGTVTSKDLNSSDSEPQRAS